MVYLYSRRGYVLNSGGKIEQLRYQDYLNEYGTDETTTPRGIGSRYFLDDKTLCTWGIRGNNYKRLETFTTKTDAKKYLYELKESYIESDWDAPTFFTSKQDLYEDLSLGHNKSIKVIKRYFRYQKYLDHQTQKLKMMVDNRPSFTVEMMKAYISSNIDMLKELVFELDKLKSSSEIELWQVKANSLVQKVSNNDFRVLKWINIYRLIREEV